MCQCQSSSLTLPSAAVMPPWAETVWERVGNTLDASATLKSDLASCSAARRPAPPPPTITASKVRLAIAIQMLHKIWAVPQQQARHEQQRRQAEPQGAEQAAPGVEIERRVREEINQKKRGEQRHHERREALHQPVPHSIMGTAHSTLHHSPPATSSARQIGRA